MMTRPKVKPVDAIRARLFRNPTAWRVLQLAKPRPARQYNPADFRIGRDDWGASLESRDPRAIEAELTHRRLRFWNSDDPDEVRRAARAAVRLDRHLDTRAIETTACA